MAATGSDHRGYEPVGSGHELYPHGPSPRTKMHLYRRCGPGRKHFYVPADRDHPDSEASYFILNPVPHRHARRWKPILYRGDNPKYFEGARVIGRAGRSTFWSSFRIELGDGVDDVLENERRASERKSHERKQKWRKAFCMGEKPPKKPLEHEKEVEGFVMALAMRRRAFLNRTLRFDWAGEEYRWSGTRSFLPSWSSSLKGMSHDLKLINSHGELAATFEKDRWATYRRSEKPGNAHNKQKSFLGTLSIYPSAGRATAVDMRRHNSSAVQSRADDLDHKLSGNKDKLEQNVKLGGQHAGDLTEEMIAFTCWMIAEAEHRLRYKIFDILQEVGENVGG